MSKHKTSWRNRVKALEYHTAGDIQDHPLQWRTHPQKQQDALRGVLEDVGVAGAMLVYQSERGGGALVRIDGHGRKDLDPAATWPCLVLDVDDREADKLLATFDPIGAQAGADAAKLDELLRGVSTGSAALQGLLSEVAEKANKDSSVTRMNHASHGYDFRDVHAGKLAYRVEAAWRAGGRLALDLFSGQGQLAQWYARRFERVIRIDKDALEGLDYVGTVASWLNEELPGVALDFDFVDFDDEGSPLREIKLFFDALPSRRNESFVLCLTDGSGRNLKSRGPFSPELYGLAGPHRQATGNDYTRFEELVTGAVEKFATCGGWAARQWSSTRGSENNVIYQTYLIERPRLPTDAAAPGQAV